MSALITNPEYIVLTEFLSRLEGRVNIRYHLHRAFSASWQSLKPCSPFRISTRVGTGARIQDPVAPDAASFLSRRPRIRQLVGFTRGTLLSLGDDPDPVEGDILSYLADSSYLLPRYLRSRRGLKDALSDGGLKLRDNCTADGLQEACQNGR